VTRIALLAFVLSAASCATPTTQAPVAPAPEPVEDASVGVLVMAHGGDEAWNRTVGQAVAGLPADVAVELAYGMANPHTLQTALDRLTERGVERVALVRAFLSGQSFRDQTLWYLGLSDRPPEQFVLMGPAAEDTSARSPLRHTLQVRTHDDGVLTSPLAGTVMADRARELSDVPASESVLLLAHGMGDDEENAGVLAAVERIAEEVAHIGFSDVRAATLREDWDDARTVAEADIRGYVGSRSAAGDRVLVLPVRLTGFGPYAEVLEGLEYVEGRGLLPHPLIGDWIMTTANSVSCEAGWGPLTGRCPSMLAEEGAGG
jgi:sirohydrochlorin ferrochelatase